MDLTLESFLAQETPPGFILRKIQPEDFHKGYFELLSHLTQVGDVSEPLFLSTLEKVNRSPDTYFILVLEEGETHLLAASSTLLVEQKLIHGMKKVGHIEDIVVNPAFQKRGLGKKMISVLISLAQLQHCYKVILDCSEDVVGFYEKSGLVRKGAYMAKYFEHL